MTNRRIQKGLILVCLILVSVFIDCSKKKNYMFLESSHRAGIKIDCSATSITKVNGSCLSMDPTKASSFMPGDFSAAWSILAPKIKTSFSAPTMCFGDFKGSAFDENEGMGSDLCNTIPVDNEGTFGVIGLAINSLPCGKPTDMAMCAAFDSCGTFALAFNGGVPTCLSFYAGSLTGVVAAVGAASSLVSDALGNFSIGFSLGRRFTQDVRIAIKDGNKVKSTTFTSKGHFFIDLGINFPTDFLKFQKLDLSSYFSLSADILFLVDFGNVDITVNGLINDLKSVSKDAAKNLLNSIVKSGSELSLTVEGTLTLNLQTMTKYLLPDFSFTLAD